MLPLILWIEEYVLASCYDFKYCSLQNKFAGALRLNDSFFSLGMKTIINVQVI